MPAPKRTEFRMYSVPTVDVFWQCSGSLATVARRPSEGLREYTAMTPRSDGYNLDFFAKVQGTGQG